LKKHALMILYATSIFRAPMSSSPKSPSAVKLSNAIRRVAITSSLNPPADKKKLEALECHYLFEISHGTGFRYWQNRFKGFFVEADIITNSEYFSPLSPQAVSAHEVTQTATPGAGRVSRWNHSIDLHYAIAPIANVSWPKLRLKISLVDRDGRTLPVGYGLAVLPTQPGNFRLEVSCWRPSGAGFFEEISSRLSGAAPQSLPDVNVVEAASGRKGLRTVGCGSVTISGALVLRRSDVHGVTAKAG
jgi:hypothetical protein